MEIYQKKKKLKGYNIYGTCIDYWKVSERSKEATL